MVIVLLMTIALLALRLVAIGAVAGIIVSGVVAWKTRCRAAAPLAVFAGTASALTTLAGVRYSQVALGVGLACYALAARFAPWLRGAASWARPGSFAPAIRRRAAAVWLFAVIGLLAWYLAFRPNLDDLREAFVPHWPLASLIVGGILFSMINAAVEEGAYRGVVLQALDASLGRKVPALVGQAVAFGALHLQGFPRGWLGVGLACGYGWLMGDLRMRAGGLLASWLVHVLTDIVIVGVVIALTVSNP